MKRLLLRWLRISERPDPPPGSAGTLTIFRSSERSLYYQGFRWAVRQLGALFGLLVSFAFLTGINLGFVGFAGMREFLDGLEQVDLRLGKLSLGLPLLDLLELIEVLAVFGFLAQLLISGTLLKLAWEMRWYMVSAESLRIREGLWSVREQTMTVANIQNLEVRQGPIQKLLGIADLEVSTAGGGSSGERHDRQRGSPLHIGRFRAIDDAHGLRDRLRDELAHHRDAGLGDPGDHSDHADHRGSAAGSAAAEGASPALAAAARVLEEARALRRAVEARAASARGPSRS